MTDQIPADKVREIVDAMRASMRRAENTCSDVGLLDDMSVYIADLVTLLPAPPRPTLADMTDEEREACGWMQADVKGEDDSAVIYDPNWKDGSATVLWPNGFIEQADWENITPRPDLPRLEWPEATPTGPDHLAVGTVIESADDPRIDALPVGSILLDLDEEAAIKGRGDWTGEGYIPIPSEGSKFGPWTVLHIPKEKA